MMYNALVNKNIDELGDRPLFIKNALSNWIHHPLFGGFGTDQQTHSFFIGLLETNGLIGLFLILHLFYISYKFIANQMKRNALPTNLFTICMLYIIALGIFNPIAYGFEVVIACFFIVPILINAFYASQEYIDQNF